MATGLDFNNLHFPTLEEVYIIIKKPLISKPWNKKTHLLYKMLDYKMLDKNTDKDTNIRSGDMILYF